MVSVRMKVILASAAATAAAGLLALAASRGGWVYFLSVDQFMASEARVDRVRLHGVVGNDAFEVSPASLLARFDLLGEHSSLRVEYTGVIPDMFRPGHDVVVEGNLGEDGMFRADTLMTKCGSRYESDGDAPHSNPRAGVFADSNAPGPESRR
jgi:cytochrome c-type biogenesis protein CcmE